VMEVDHMLISLQHAFSVSEGIFSVNIHVVNNRRVFLSSETALPPVAITLAIFLDDYLY